METFINDRKATIADYKKLPEGARVELIEGNLVAEPSPEYLHQTTSISLAAQIFNHAGSFGLGRVLAAPMDVYLDGENALQPDILFIAKENFSLIEKDGIHGAPDLVIEILSPSNAYHDFTTKFHIYEKHGVKEYFIVDPETKEVLAYSLIDGKFKEVSRASGIVRSRILKMEFVF